VLGFEPKVALIKTYPNSDPGIIDYYVSKGYKGIILEGTGLGHTPVSTANKDFSWLGKIKTAIDSGLIIGMTSQCLYGRVNKNVYRNLRLLSSAGVVYCEDMLPEVAYVKLGFLLGNFKKEEARSMLSENITGEITPRTEIEWFI
jgi:glutamyl-tRNA(Gln) amidotransferase subunit D